MFGKGMAEAVAAKAGSGGAKATAPQSDEWVGIQKNTFTAWVNTQLEKGGHDPVSQIEVDFKDGVPLIRMIEVVSEKKFGKYSKTPKLKVHKLENITNFLEFLKKEGLTLVNIGSGDIEDGNLKLVLGLLWTIIYHYQVSQTFKDAGAAHGKKGGARDLLLEWVRSKIPEHNIKNFKTDWNDGRALASLVNVIGGEPEIFPHHKDFQSGAAKRNAKLAIDAAHEELGIPKILRTEDLTNPNLDELSMMTYISYFRTATRQDHEKAGVEVREPSPVPPAAAEPEPEPEPEPAGNANSGGLPPPWERAADWRKYEGDDLGGRCKIRVYYSTTTSSQVIRKNSEQLMMLLERLEVHKRPDFEPWVPIDLEMNKETRDRIFAKAGERVTPLMFIDDEFVGGYDKIMEMNESGELRQKLEY